MKLDGHLETRPGWEQGGRMEWIGKGRETSEDGTTTGKVTESQGTMTRIELERRWCEWAKHMQEICEVKGERADLFKNILGLLSSSEMVYKLTRQWPQELIVWSAYCVPVMTGVQVSYVPKVRNYTVHSHPNLCSCYQDQSMFKPSISYRQSLWQVDMCSRTHTSMTEHPNGWLMISYQIFNPFHWHLR